MREGEVYSRRGEGCVQEGEVAGGGGGGRGVMSFPWELFMKFPNKQSPPPRKS